MDLGTSLFLPSARLGSVQDSHPYEFLVAASQQDTLVSEKFRVRGVLGRSRLTSRTFFEARYNVYRFRNPDSSIT